MDIETTEFLDAQDKITVEKESTEEIYNCKTTVVMNDLNTKNDWLQLGDFCTNKTQVNCVFENGNDILATKSISQANATPTLAACNGMMADTLLQGPSAFMSVVGQQNFQVIFNTGASLAISGKQDNFEGKIKKPMNPIRLGGMVNGLNIEGIGIVNWVFTAADGNNLAIQSQCYYVPQAKVCLISPQRLFCKSIGVTGEFVCTEDNCQLNFTGHSSLKIDYNTKSHLLICYGRNAVISAPQINLGSVMDEDNENLTPSMKLLLLWHYWFGHRNLSAVCRLLASALFGSKIFLLASRSASGSSHVNLRRLIKSTLVVKPVPLTHIMKVH